MHIIPDHEQFIDAVIADLQSQGYDAFREGGRYDVSGVLHSTLLKHFQQQPSDVASLQAKASNSSQKTNPD